jgi:ATP-dependent RNA helicase DeaD
MTTLSKNESSPAKNKFAAKKSAAPSTKPVVQAKASIIPEATESSIVKTAVKTTVTTTLPLGNFESFNFSEEMNKAIKELGYISPSPIQQEAIPLLLGQQTDFLGLAATGTGKTAAFGIPLLENLKANAKGVQALILCPTRELAKQTTEQINLLGRYKKTKAIAIYGGADYGGQLRALKEGVSIVVGTPGRIIDHLERGTLNLDNLQNVVLDEADEMISMGFKQEIEFILEKVNQEEKHQTWLFSATMSREVRKIADQFLDSPKQIQINKTEVVSSEIRQLFYQVREDEKPQVIEKIIDLTPQFFGLIFCQTKALVIDLTNTLRARGYPVDCLHGDMDQNARERAMKAFKAKHTTVMVCTDVASRGIDVKELTHVINYSLPRELDLYVHRIGRTGRGGKEGIALSLVTASHMGLISRIERSTQSRITRVPVPNDADVMKIKVAKLFTEFMESVETKESAGITAIKDLISASEFRKKLGYMDKEEIVARFLAQKLIVPAKPAAPAGEGFRGEGAYSGDRERRPFRDHKDRNRGRPAQRPRH